MNRVRCAIYTRKSSDEGLEQAFNSLDAQREACAAYVLSQASEGWNALPDIYDDGGLSGGTLERPALQRLLGDIAAGKVDIIVVYKVDRLTRSLLDFSKLVEIFDQAGVSFVSITQSFNTTTSMGRLTLNMLLSFAQFEREVTAERIRDKIAASKAKGMWMGGLPPLGYRPDGRTLEIVEPHAALVQGIFQRYLDIGNVRLLVDRLNAERIHTPVRQMANGRAFGGVPFSRGQIYAILKNPIYIGEIPHRDQRHKGLHKAIVDRQIWDATQTLLAGHVPGVRRRSNTASGSLLAGLIVDDTGEKLIAAHACRAVSNGGDNGKVRYRYYVSQSAHHGTSEGKGTRIPAREIETATIEALAAAFDDPMALMQRTGIPLELPDMERIFSTSRATAAMIRKRDPHILRAIIAGIVVHPTEVSIELLMAAVAQHLSVSPPPDADTIITLACPVRMTRTGHRLRLVQNDGRSVAAAPPDASMIKLLVKAHKWWGQLQRGEVTVRELAEAEGVVKSYVTRVVRLAFLAPAIVDDVLAGRQVATIDAKRLAFTADLPVSWEEQTKYFGMGV
ncbi:resolvase [Sphingomonas sp. Leaf357]|uniref:recombinase family protein n=1 Tax=Sphingomonas sp. Leaf357 TaxID=1736350 RepID=UPI0006F5F2E5|nr:recombinase family protein [Sphingomonas sp. Leaf357]KQS03651.1 resolvase [Sphingomonas sp. Leaf357]